MAKGKYAGKKSLNVKPIAMLLAIGLLVGSAVGGTLAWLTDQTKEVKNTFTVGNIDIDLGESENLDLKMVPGFTITKDPKVTVKKDSEESWVFVKVQENIGLDGYEFDDFIEYEVLSGKTDSKVEDTYWLPLTGNDGVYYCHVKATDADVVLPVIGYKNGSTVVENQVLVKDTVTKDMMNLLDGVDANGNTVQAEIDARPTLTFTAYAIQYYSTNGTPFTVADAWKEVK